MKGIKLSVLLKSLGFNLIILAICFSLNPVSFAIENNQVDVGLIFGANNQFPIGVTSKQGFVFGSEVGGVFSSILDLSQYQSLTIAKDGFYETGSPNLVTSPQGYYLNGQVKGGYHVQIGEFYQSYEQLIANFEIVKTLTENAYIVYDDGWRIFSDMYVTQLEAEQQLNALSTKLSAFVLTIAETNPGRVILFSNNKPVFCFDTTEQEYVFKSELFTLNAIEYRNSFIVKRLSGSDFTFINRVAIDEYLFGVVPKEMSSSWPIEALKAQAIASRNFVLTASNKYANWGFDVCNTVNSQVYGGYTAEKPSSNRAVTETSGFALMYDGQLIPMYFHAHSGGITDDSENVWSAKLPYIRSTLDLYSIGSPNTDWSITMNHADIESRLIVAGYNVGSLKMLRILERFDSGRVSKMEFIGTLGTATISKDKIRSVLGSSVVKSLLFSFDPATAVTDTLVLTNGLNNSQINTNQNTASNVVSETTRPVVLRTNAGIHATFMDDSHITIVENGNTTTVAIDKIALKNAKDIYVTASNISIPYQFNNSESIDMSGGNVILYGHGYGHGLGMSQWGAKKMADEGKTFEEILLFYYQNTQLVRP